MKKMQKRPAGQTAIANRPLASRANAKTPDEGHRSYPRSAEADAKKARPKTHHKGNHAWLARLAVISPVVDTVALVRT